MRVAIVIMLVREMMADDAAGDRTKHGVVMREVARDGADGRAFEASFRLGIAGEQSRQGEHDDKSGGEARHGRLIPAALQGGIWGAPAPFQRRIVSYPKSSAASATGSGA